MMIYSIFYFYLKTIYFEWQTQQKYNFVHDIQYVIFVLPNETPLVQTT